MIDSSGNFQTSKTFNAREAFTYQKSGDQKVKIECERERECESEIDYERK